MTLDELRRKLADFERSGSDPGYVRLTFGRYKDQRLRDTPIGYLLWLREELSKTPRLAGDLLTQLNRFLDAK